MKSTSKRTRLSASSTPRSLRIRKSAKQSARTSSAATLSIEGIPFELPGVSPASKQRAARLLKALQAEYPDAKCELNYSNACELLVATILSAQATDVGVNKATPALFARFKTPADYAAASPAQIEPYIKTIGLYRSKAQSIHQAMTRIRDHFANQVPASMDDLLSLRGVARKTANVVLSNAFNINMGVVVDTHVERLSRRLGLVNSDDKIPQIERRLMAMFPRESWGDISHLLIFHGRRVCKARLPACANHSICRQFGSCCELPAKTKIPH